MGIRDFYSEEHEVSTLVKRESLLSELMGQVNTILSHRARDPVDPVHYAFMERCVYVRFSGEQEAVDFYNAANAQWFDNKLLTPKFIKDEKYFQRFPTARPSRADY